MEKEEQTIGVETEAEAPTADELTEAALSPETMDILNNVRTWKEAISAADGNMKEASKLWEAVKKFRSAKEGYDEPVTDTQTGEVTLRKGEIERKHRDALPAPKMRVDDRVMTLYNHYREAEGFKGNIEDFLNQYPLYAAKKYEGLEPGVFKGNVTGQTVGSMIGTKGAKFGETEDHKYEDALETALEALEGNPKAMVLKSKLDELKLDREIKELKLDEMRLKIEDRGKTPDAEDKVEVPVDMGKGQIAMVPMTPMQYVLYQTTVAGRGDAAPNPLMETTEFLDKIGVLGKKGGDSDEMREMRSEMRDLQKDLHASELRGIADGFGRDVNDLSDKLQWALERDDFGEYTKYRDKLSAMGIDVNGKAAEMAESRQLTEKVVGEVRAGFGDIQKTINPLVEALANNLRTQQVQQSPQPQQMDLDQKQKEWELLYAQNIQQELAKQTGKPQES